MITDIKINVKSISLGSEEIELFFGDTVVSCCVSYMGREPFSTLIQSLIAFNEETVNRDYRTFHTYWADDPDGGWDVDFYWDLETDTVEFMIEYDNKKKGELREIKYWEFEVSYKDYKRAVIGEGLRLLKKYGLAGFNQNWCDGYDTFPINSFLMLLGNTSEYDEKKEVLFSNIFSELKLLKSALNTIRTLPAS